MARNHLLHGHMPFWIVISVILLLMLVSAIIHPKPGPFERRECGLAIALFILGIVIYPFRYLFYKLFRC